MSLAERRGGNRSVIPETTLREAEMSTVTVDMDAELNPAQRLHKLGESLWLEQHQPGHAAHRDAGPVRA